MAPMRPTPALAALPRRRLSVLALAIIVQLRPLLAEDGVGLIQRACELFRDGAIVAGGKAGLGSGAVRRQADAAQKAEQEETPVHHAVALPFPARMRRPAGPGARSGLRGLRDINAARYEASEFL